MRLSTHFLDLSLEVGRAKSVLGAFKLFTQVEVLDGDNKYRCEGKSAGSKSHLTGVESSSRASRRTCSPFN